MASISTLLFSQKSIRTMQLTSCESASQRSHPRLSNPTPIANPIFRFAPAPKPWAAFTKSSATVPCNLLTRCLMKFSPICLRYCLRILLTIFCTKVQMAKPTNPFPIHLLSTPMIPSIFPEQFVDAGLHQFYTSANRQHH